MDRIRSNWIQNRVRFIIKSIQLSIICSVVYQSVTNHGFINLIIIVETNRMCLIPDSCSYLLYQSFFHILIFGWNVVSFNNKQTTQSIKCLRYLIQNANKCWIVLRIYWSIKLNNPDNYCLAVESINQMLNEWCVFLVSFRYRFIILSSSTVFIGFISIMETIWLLWYCWSWIQWLDGIDQSESEKCW